MPNTTKRPAGKNHPADIQNANNRVKKYISVISAVLLLCTARIIKSLNDLIHFGIVYPCNMMRYPVCTLGVIPVK